MLDIYKEIVTALKSEDRVMLATIISTSGSTPASALSRMLIKNDCTTIVGTVGGGCMEADVAEHARLIFPERRAKIVSYRLTEDGIEQGLICGGTLNLLIEPVTKDRIPLFDLIRQVRDEGEDCVLSTILTDKGSKIDKAVIPHPDSPSPRLTGQYVISARELAKQCMSDPEEIENLVRKVYKRGETEYLKIQTGELILEPVPGKPSLVIFGGGHVSKFVSRTASMSGFGVTIVDDREMFSNPERFPEAEKTLAVGYEDAFRHLTIKPSTYIVIVTRGHRYDEIVLEQAVKTPAKYIGMIGSKRKVFTTYQRLIEKGTPVELLKNIYAPMGIDIGAVTAEEIAVSIVSEMIKIRRAGANELIHKSDTLKPLFSKLKPEKLETG